jgi:hypothetical protein
MTDTTTERNQIMEALHGFIAQRGGIEPGNYGDYASYRQEQRSVTRDRHHAERLLGAIRWRDSIGADQLKEAMKRAFSGRLSWENGRVEYTAGQYFPTEYRKAVCAVAAAALWDYWREGYINATPEEYQEGRAAIIAHDIRKSASKEFGLEIAKRYFDYRASDYR